MPSSDSAMYQPPRRSRCIDRMTLDELSALRAWAADLCLDPVHPVAVLAKAAALCRLLDQRGRTATARERAPLNMGIARLLDELEDAALMP